MTNFSKAYVSCMGGGILQTHDNKVLRPSASFIINRTQLNTLYVRKCKFCILTYISISSL